MSKLERPGYRYVCHACDFYTHDWYEWMHHECEE